MAKLRGIATLHPAAIARDQNLFPVCCNDLIKGLIEPPEFYTPYPSIEDVRNFRYDTFAFDIETPKYKILGDKAPVEMVGLCGRASYGLCVPVQGPYIAELKRIFANAKQIIGHNFINFDWPRLQRDLNLKVSPDCKHWDTILMHHLVFPNLPHDLEFVGTQLTDRGNWKADKQSLQIYNLRDTDVTFQCWKILLPLLQKENLVDLYEQVQIPLTLICNEMHNVGFRVDPERIVYVREKLIAERDAEEKHLPEPLRTHEVPVRKRIPAPDGTLGKSGKPVKFLLVPSSEQVVPWRSPKVKQRYLYTKEEPWCLGFDPILDPDSGNVTTGKLALDRIYSRTKDRGVQALKRLNQIDELLTTFTKDSIAKAGRVHSSFSPYGTSTGRLSSSDPNCQNIPDPARYMYVPSHEDWSIISIDFSGIENRLQAYFAGDTERLRRMDIPGFSEHKYLASKISGIPMEQIHKSTDPASDYSKAKHVVHGVDRGLGPQSASKKYDLDFKETKKLFDLWKQEIKKTILWQNRLAQEAKQKGVLTNPFGRKGWFYTSSYYTESLSFPPQSTGADIIYRVMIALHYERIGWPEEKVKKIVRVYRPLPWPAKLLLQVHDELVFECPDNMVDEVIEIISSVMLQPWAEVGGMVIPIGITVGKSWGECEKYISPADRQILSNVMEAIEANSSTTGHSN